MENPQKIIRVKNRVAWILVSLAVLFMVLCFVPKARQEGIFPYGDLCDYRAFILPTIKSALPYEPDTIYARDACYPPIAYCAVKALSDDKGEKWKLTKGETRLLASILVVQLLGTLLLVWKIPDVKVRVAAGFAIMMSPACICSVLRGNPSGWAFALVCVFVYWYKSENRWLRMLAALSLGMATALKISPCLFGVLYLTDAFRSPRRIPYVEIFVAASSAIVLIFVPFLFFGGMGSIQQWISNAKANADHYAMGFPTWGLVGLANGWIDSATSKLPGVFWFSLATRMLSLVLVILSLFTRRNYLRLMFIGVAMAFTTHHDYGGAYLIPAFVAWLCDSEALRLPSSGVWLLLEAVSWCVVMMPLQIPNPCRPGTMNVMLQNEFLLGLLISAVVCFVFEHHRCRDEVAS